MNEELFTTDLERLTSVLATNLYDDPFVPIREVLQNASDACLIRQGFSTFDVGRITVSVNKKPGERYIEVLDNGCGMTKDELTSVLSRIASSNKVHKRQKLIDLGFEGASAIAGKFGLGILSCFIVSKRVEILTRSMERNSPTFKWESKGDGKYYWDLVRQAMDIGTRIRLYLKDDAYLDRLLDQRELQSVITHHCRFVRIPIYFGRTGFPLNSSVAPWEPTCPDDDVEDFIRSHFDRDALYHFRFSHEGDVVLRDGRFASEIAANVSLKAMAFIPHTSWSNEYLGKADVYASGIYVGRLQEVLPDWFTFGVVVLESSSLDLTLGRDNIVQDKWLEAVKQIIAHAATQHIVKHLADRSSVLRQRFGAIFRVHGEDIKNSARRDRTSGSGLFFQAVKDVIPFDYRGNLVSIPEFASSTARQGDRDGRRVVYYYSRGFGERGSGLQEQVLFDSANIPYLNAENYYDRDFLETYHQASKEYYLVPIQDGFQYVLNFEGIEDEVRETVQEAYRQLGINAKACRFSPADLPAVITAVSSDRPKEEDHDVRTPEGRQKLIETLAKQEALVRVDSGYTLCVNLTNTMVGDVIDRILRGGSLAPYRLALRLIYNSAVILFGEPSNREMARVVASGNTLMQSYLTTLDNLDSERERFRRLLASRDDIIEKLEGEVETFRESIKRTDAEAEARKAAETNRVFLSYSYHEDDEVLADGLRELLTSKDFVVTDGKASRLGRIGENILEKIKSSGYFVAIMTKRIEIQGESFTTSPWFLEEKGVALGAGKIAVLMVEEGVGEEFAGKLQGDLQRFHFNRGKDFMSRSLKVADLMVRHREKVLAELSGESGD